MFRSSAQTLIALSTSRLRTATRIMGKKDRRQAIASEEHLLLPPHNTVTIATPLIDTHTHLASTFSMYQQKYKSGRYQNLFEFVHGMYEGRNVAAVIDVWCEAPVQKSLWKEIADSALAGEEKARLWRGIEYWFVMGVHPHEAKFYTDEVEKDILEAMTHPRCVGWGEIGLDYHYDNSPREVQRQIFVRQLRHAVRLGKPITIHTREAEEDTEVILMEEIPKDHKIHIHCCTDSPDFAQRLIKHFPNLYIGITGVVTYSSNLNTSEAIRRMAAASDLRILLETDAPYMIPGNIYASMTGVKGKLPICHSAMIPWTADYVAKIAGEDWDTIRVLKVAEENARKVYGI